MVRIHAMITLMKFLRLSTYLGLGIACFAQHAMAQEEVNLADAATPPESLTVKEGFKVELVYTVPRETEGSWVSLCIDPKGRFITSDQYGGLYRITVPRPGEEGEVEVERIDLDIGHAQGLLYAFNSLYAVVNSEAHQGRGLYRIMDADQDDHFDTVKLLKKFEEQGGEHGPHAVVLGPDRRSLYIVVGNQTPLPDYDVSRVPEVWGEDLILPRIYGRGFMRGVEAPRGWIAKTDPAGKHWEIIATGFRNEYDAAFNRHGELFTFDADMEWDMNTPWYRPTRICHVVSGAEFGWRNGSGKWPVYYPDSVPPVVDIGPGSPTGVVFGYGAKFPVKYRDAFYACDWSYGKLYAVHLTPDGASYSGEFEEFIAGQPLPLTDIVVNPRDGAMYFTIGGRRTQSALYRVTYAGDESVPEELPAVEESPERQLRHRLEAFHGQESRQAIRTTWLHLADEDRFIRWAARVALEHQDPSDWQERALQDERPQAILETMLALTRVGSPDLQPRILDSLGKLNWDQLSLFQKLSLARVYQLAFVRMGEPDEETRKEMIERLDPHYPTEDPDLNNELCQLLVYFQAPAAAEKTIPLLKTAETQEQQINYAKSLRLLTNGWTMELRSDYFQWFNKASGYRGGASFGKFVEYIKNDALERLTEGQRTALKPIIEAEPEQKTPLEIMSEAIAGRSFVKEWTMEELAPALQDGLQNRNFERGKKMFSAAACFACHRFKNQGGALGPDLTAAGGRFSPIDLLDSILNPSKEISDQYSQVVITLNDGSRVTGRVVNMHGNNLSVNTNMFDPGEMANVDRRRVKSIEPAKVSMMPEGLLNMLTEEEIKDLLAYLISGGNPDHPVFQ